MYLCCPVGEFTPPPIPPLLEFGLEGSVPGDRDNGEVECVCGEWRDVSAVVVAPGFVEVVIVRGVEEEFEEECVVVEEVVCVCVLVEGEGPFPCWRAECARKAARKFERKGRFVGILNLF